MTYINEGVIDERRNGPCIQTARHDMSLRRIVIIQGHPDPRGARLCHALADAYVMAAQAAGHSVERIDVASLPFLLLRTRDEYYHEKIPENLRAAQEAIGRADHLVLIYPLWMGCMPALLKGFLEQTLRPGFAYHLGKSPASSRRLLHGKSARIIVTMAMPALVYRWFFGAHSLKALRRNIFGLCGIRPIRSMLLGGVESSSERQRHAWLTRIRLLGTAGA